MKINGDIKVSDVNLPLKDGFEKDIIAYGSNNNGYYIKFRNGAMICWNRLEVTFQFTKQFSTSGCYYGYVEPGYTYFPQTFYGYPITIYSNPQSQTNCFGLQPYPVRFSDRPPGFYPIGAGVSLNANQTVNIAYVALGRWRAWEAEDSIGD